MVLFSLARALVLMRFRLFTLKRSKTIELKVVTYVELNWACYKHTRLRYFQPSFFGPCTLIRYVCVFVLNHFQERFQIDAFSKNAKRISVDGTPKLVEREGCLKPVDRRKQAVTFSSPEMRYIWPAPPIERARKLVPE